MTFLVSRGTFNKLPHNIIKTDQLKFNTKLCHDDQIKIN